MRGLPNAARRAAQREKRRKRERRKEKEKEKKKREGQEKAGKTVYLVPISVTACGSVNCDRNGHQTERPCDAGHPKYFP
jgi:hypothetical protein